MEINKNESLFTYIDSLETQDLYINIINKKIPKLNKYAELYLANLEKEKSRNEENSNNSSKNNINLNIDNIKENDNISSIKGGSNDMTNIDSVINANKIKKFHFKNESNESNQFKSINYLAIEQLKMNMENKAKRTNIISKVNDFTISQNNNKILNNKNKQYNQQGKFYYKIKPSVRNKIRQNLFFNFKINNSVKLDGKFKFSYNIKTLNNFNFNKSENKLKENNNSKNKSYFPKKFNNNNLYTNKNKKKFIIFPVSNYMTNPNNKSFRNELFSNSMTENSIYNSMISKKTDNNKNQKHLITLNDHWVEKEIKKRMKIFKLIEEKTLKETSELRDKPKINRNSRKIAEKLGSNSSTSVFERLSESGNKILFNGRKMSILTKDKINNKNNKNFQSVLNTNRNNKKNVGIGKFKTFKQFGKGEQTKTEVRNSKKQKILKVNKKNSKKYETNIAETKYIKKFMNINKTKTKINTTENFKKLNDINYMFGINSIENIKKDNNMIHNNLQKSVNNRKLANFLNKNQSSESFYSEEISSTRKTNTKFKYNTTKNNYKNISEFEEGRILKEEINDNYNKKRYKKITPFKLSDNKIKKIKVINTKDYDENIFNINKNNNKKNNLNDNNYMTINATDFNNNKKVSNFNISSNQINENINKIRKRKMDLIKILNFSSNIGINKNQKY